MKPTFEQYLNNIFGNELSCFLNHPPVSDFIRINTMRATANQVTDILNHHGFKTEPVEGLNDCLRILYAPFDPTQCLHHFAGWFVKQSLSSQIPVRCMDIQPGQTVMDLCAAPGSKTTQIASYMRNSGCLYANDLSGKRMTPLASRLDACGVSHAVLYNQAAERLTQILPPIFDRVLADVPCTGLGHNDTLDENRNRYEHAKNPSAQYQLQYRILLTGCRLLKVGGKIVYSTCSLNPEEDEAVVDELVGRYGFKILEIPEIEGIRFRPGITQYQGKTFDPSLCYTRRITPWENDTQGFFVAVLEKTQELPERIQHIDPQAPTIEPKCWQDPDILPIIENFERYYGIHPGVFKNYHFILANNRNAIYCLDAHWDKVICGYQRAGIGLARRRGGIWRLSHTMIQQLSPFITQNKILLNDEQMAEIAQTGETAIPGITPESPYPVIAHEQLGCIASGYDLQNGRILWKRPCSYYL